MAPGDQHPAGADTRQRVLNALARNKLIEGLVHKQSMRQHDRVESLVHKQNLSELSKLVLPLSDQAIGALLGEVDQADQLTLWRLLPPDRADAVLLWLADELREWLVARMPVQGVSQRVSAFARVGEKFVQCRIDRLSTLGEHSLLWVDLIDARPFERAAVEQHFGISLPDPQNVTDLETSARFYVDDAGAFHLYSDFLLATETGSRSVRVAFLLFRGCLISLRQEELPAFRLQRARSLSFARHLGEGSEVLLDLYAADVEYSAATLESVDAVLESVSKRVLGAQLSDRDAVDVLGAIGVQETLNGRIRRNLMDTRRALSFLGRARLLTGRLSDEAAQIVRDIDSLDGHTAFLFDKINFLLDATVGFININQNKIIRMFSVASVALLPPTLIASIYGMNFASMPELALPYGYPLAIGMMLLSVTVPLLYFRRRGWLR
jgi:magnesium transporter